MSEMPQKYPENVAGIFYVNSDCVDCDLCANFAPKNFQRNPEIAEEGEKEALVAYTVLLDQQTDTKARLKAAQDELYAKLDAKYPRLTEQEIKTLVIEDKWLATLSTAIQGELDRVSQTLTGRIRILAERYATPLPNLTDEVAALAAKVDGHLKKMGAVL